MLWSLLNKSFQSLQVLQGRRQVFDNGEANSMKIKGVGEDNFDAFILLKYKTVSSDPSFKIHIT